MAIAYHTHTFSIPTADAADLLAGTEGGKVITPDVLGPVTAAGKALLDDANAAAQRTTLGLGSSAVAALIDDDTMATATASNIPSAESVKAYADTKQPGDPTLTALAGVSSAANKVPYFTGSDTAGLLDFKDEDNMASDSATAVPSQQSVKAFASNSANVTYAQSGVGAVTRAILDYIREREKSVTEYGVDNTGATDVAATLEACLEMGGSWWVPAGDYKITSALEATITSSLYVRCHPDARFFAPGRDGNMINIVVPSDGAGLPATGISFIWDGGFIDQSEQKVATVVPFAETYPPPTGLAGTVGSTDGILIRGNYDDGSGTIKSGIALAVFQNVVGYAGEHWQSAGGDSCLAFAGCRTMVVMNSTFRGSRDQAVYFNNDGTGALDDSSVIAYGNTCINCAGGLAAKRSVRHVTFVNNIVDGSLTGLSISNGAGPGSRSGLIAGNEIRRSARSIVVAYANNVSVHDNRINDAGALLEDGTKAVGTYGLYGVLLLGSQHCDVHDNRGKGVSALWSGALTAFVQLDDYDPGTGSRSCSYNNILDNISHGWPRPVQETAGSYNRIDGNIDTDPSLGRYALKSGDNHRQLRWEVLDHDAGAWSHTGDTNQTTVKTVSIPGRMLGKKGRLLIRTVWSRTGDATVRIRYNGGLMMTVALTGSGIYRDEREIINVGATNVQKVAGGAMVGGWGTVSGSLTTGSADTTQTLDMDFQVVLVSGADSAQLESYIIEYLAA